MKPTDEQVERVAEAIRRNKFERNGRLSIYEAGLCSPEEIGEARAAIAAMPALPAQGEPAAIFEECAEIALEHVGACYPVSRESYDEACREIAEAIRLRASNRKTMDAVAAEKSRK